MNPTENPVVAEPQTCPVPTAHRRLRDSHLLWHQTLDSYGDPNGFRANLNSAIQAFRSVTLMLQNEKRSVPGFEEWYGVWQDEMRTDPVLKWLHDARTRVFHQGDLETYSSARVRIRDEWAPAKVLGDEEVLPFDSTETIAWGLAAGFAGGFEEQFGSPIPEYLVLEVERRWVDRELPDWELVDALAHCYGVIARIVAEAHDRCGAPFDTLDLDHGGVVMQADHLDGRLPCMVASAERRTASVKVHSGELFQIERQPFTFEEEAIQRAADKYGLRNIAPADQPDVMALAETYFQIARRALLVDTYVVPVTFLIGPNGITQVVHPAQDRAEKFLNWDAIAADVERLGATAIVSIAEAWVPLVPGSAALARITRSVREEHLAVTAATEDGRVRTWSMPFTKRLGRIVPGNVIVQDLDVAPNFISAVTEVWKRQKR